MELVTLIGFGILAASGGLLAKNHTNTKKIKELQDKISAKNSYSTDSDKEKEINNILTKVQI